MENFLLFCCRTCLKSDDNREYYEILELASRKATIEDIRRAYKKASLNLHPDKLAQRGITVTEEHKKQFLKVKEAYDVLSDPKRRKLYDRLGATGLKLIENPQELSPTDLLRNFQRNRSGRYTIGLAIILFFAALLVLPVLFSLKCDGTLGRDAPWLAIWTPMWIVDGFFLLVAVSICAQKGGSSAKRGGGDGSNGEAHDEDDETDDPSLQIPLSVKVHNFLTTALFVLIQIFVLMRLDRRVHWSWFAVFSPWFIYEAVVILPLLPSACFAVPTPNFVDSPDVESPDEEALLQRLRQESEYFAKCVTQQQDRLSIIVSVLRVWQAIFLAVQLDGSVNWNWGLVFLPMWLYVFAHYVYACIFRSWGTVVVEGVAERLGEHPENMSHLDAAKLNQGQALLSSGNSYCYGQFIPLLIALLLVSRLQVSSFSTFVIIFPVFVILGCCCCGACCFFLMASCVDTEELEKIQKEGEGGGVGNEGGSYVPEDPEIVSISKTEVVVLAPEEFLLATQQQQQQQQVQSDNSNAGSASSPNRQDYGSFGQTDAAENSSDFITEEQVVITVQQSNDANFGDIDD